MAEAEEITTGPNFSLAHLETFQRQGLMIPFDFQVALGDGFAWSSEARVLVVPKELEQEPFESALAKLVHEAGHAHNITEITTRAIEVAVREHRTSKTAAFAFDYLVEEIAADIFIRQQSPTFLFPQIKRSRNTNAAEFLAKSSRKRAKEYQGGTPLHVQFCEAVLFRYQALGLPKTTDHPLASPRIVRLAQEAFPEIAKIAEIENEQQRVIAIFNSQAFLKYLRLYHEDAAHISSPQISQAEIEFIRQVNPSMAKDTIPAATTPETVVDEPAPAKGKEKKTGGEQSKGPGDQSIELEEDAEYSRIEFESDWQAAGKDALRLFELLQQQLASLSGGQEKPTRRPKRPRAADEGEDLYIEEAAAIAIGAPKFETPAKRRTEHSPEPTPYYQLPILFLVLDQSGSQDKHAKERGYLTLVLERLRGLLQPTGQKDAPLPLLVGVVGVDTESATIINVNDLIDGENRPDKEKSYQRVAKARAKRGGTNISRGVDAIVEMFKLMPEAYQRKSLLVILTDLQTNQEALQRSIGHFLALTEKNGVLGLGPFIESRVPYLCGRWSEAATKEEKLKELVQAIVDVTKETSVSKYCSQH